MTTSGDMYDCVPTESVKPPISIRKNSSRRTKGIVCVQSATHVDEWENSACGKIIWVLIVDDLECQAWETALQAGLVACLCCLPSDLLVQVLSLFWFVVRFVVCAILLHGLFDYNFLGKCECSWYCFVTQIMFTNWKTRIILPLLPLIGWRRVSIYSSYMIGIFV